MQRVRNHVDARAEAYSSCSHKRRCIFCDVQLSTNNFFDDSGLPADRYPIDIKTWETIDADHEDFYQWCHNLLPGMKRLFGTVLGCCTTSTILSYHNLADVLTDSSPNWVTQVGNQTARNSRQTPGICDLIPSSMK